MLADEIEGFLTVFCIDHLIIPAGNKAKQAAIDKLIIYHKHFAPDRFFASDSGKSDKSCLSGIARAAG